MSLQVVSCVWRLCFGGGSVCGIIHRVCPGSYDEEESLMGGSPRVLAVNPGGMTTKLAVYEGDDLTPGAARGGSAGKRT